MNEAVFIAAVLFEKGILNKGEASALVRMAQTETFSASLQEMIGKVGRALGTMPESKHRKFPKPSEINAVDLLPGRLNVEKDK